MTLLTALISLSYILCGAKEKDADGGQTGEITRSRRSTNLELFAGFAEIRRRPRTFQATTQGAFVRLRLRRLVTPLRFGPVYKFTLLLLLLLFRDVASVLTPRSRGRLEAQ